MPADEYDPPPPPPPSGISATWQHTPKAGLRPAPPPSEGPQAASPTAPAGASAPEAPPSPVPPLPPATPPWGFREYLVEPSAKAARGLTEALGQKGKPAAEVVERLFQAAFMHPTIYRRAAESPGWMREAVALVGAVVLLTTVWYFARLFAAYGPGLFFLLKMLALRVLAFLAFVLALQLAAKQLHQVDLPYEPWFRALAYAATASALATLPVLGPLFGLWGLTCSIAAIMDVSGVDLAKAIVLLLVAAVCAALVIFVFGLVLL